MRNLLLPENNVVSNSVAIDTERALMERIPAGRADAASKALADFLQRKDNMNVDTLHWTRLEIPVSMPQDITVFDIDFEFANPSVMIYETVQVQAHISTPATWSAITQEENYTYSLLIDERSWMIIGPVRGPLPAGAPTTLNLHIIPIRAGYVHMTQIDVISKSQSIVETSVSYSTDKFLVRQKDHIKMEHIM